MTDNNRRPVDALAMNRLLWRHKSDFAGVILRLVWKAGLKREEARGLRWEQVDFDASALALPDRTVPMDEDTKASLRLWRDARPAGGASAEFVLTAPRTGKQASAELITHTAQRAMRRAGMDVLRLEELRADYIRRTRETSGDLAAMRLSGTSVRTYSRLTGVPADGIARSADAGAADGDRLWSLLQAKRSGAEAVALWLSRQANLSNREILALTWDDVDLERGVITVGGGERYMLKELIAVLKAEKEQRTAADDPHVVLSPVTRAAMSDTAFSAMLKDYLIRGGLGGSLGALRSDERRERELGALRRLAAEREFFTARDAMLFTGMEKHVFYARVRTLLETGELVRAGGGYLPAARYIPPERREAAVLACVAQNGAITIAQAAETLRLTRAEARRLLLDMEAAGTLDSAGRHRRFRRKTPELS